MERRVLLAAIVSSIFLAWYSQVVLKPAQTARSQAGASPVPAQSERADGAAQATATPFDAYHLGEEDVVKIESDHLSVEIGTGTGAIRSVEMKQLSGRAADGHVVVAGDWPIFMPVRGGRKRAWQLGEKEEGSIRLDSMDTTEASYHLAYTMDRKSSLVRWRAWETGAAVDSVGGDGVVASWGPASGTNGRQNPLEAMTARTTGEKLRYKRFYTGNRVARNVPRGTSWVTLGEKYFCESIRMESGAWVGAVLPSSGERILVELTNPTGAADAGMLSQGEIYFGPRDYFFLKPAGFEKAFPIGLFGKIGLVLLTVLSWVASVTKSYGVGIIVFSAIITCATAPFTIISFRTTRKMQELKPEIDRMMEKHKGDKVRANRELFELYKKHKVSPVSGCLPVLLQMPILIALIQAMTHFIELRGRSFLWIRDLSLPDRFAKLPVSIPMIGEYVNLLPIIMAGAMYVQTRLSQSNTLAGKTDPATAMMTGPLMPIIFGLMFYQFQSGLVLYWLSNSLLTMVWYKVAK